jgi:glutamate synthase (NADPH/NADH) large chain
MADTSAEMSLDADEVREELHQGDRQGAAEGDVQDGHLDLSVLLRRADLRRGRAVASDFVDALLHRHRQPPSKASACARSPKKPSACIAHAFGDNPIYRTVLDVGGEYACRAARRGRMLDAGVGIAKLQHAVRGNSQDQYQALTPSSSTTRAERSPDHARPVASSAADRTVTGQSRWTKSNRRPRSCKRFATGAMSLRLHLRARRTPTLAIAMNRIGGKSNTGEGGEEADRYQRRSVRMATSHCARAIKQVASGRFGVTAEYLVNADQIQIKMAQGAKPGEGGQLPGPQGRRDTSPSCVTRRRASGLISPAAAPRHLLHRGSGAADPRPEERQPAAPASASSWCPRWAWARSPRAWPRRKADHVTISGYDGGTGASP